MVAPAMTYALFAPVVLFAIYRRVCRNFGRQPLRSTRLAVRVVIFAVIAVLLLVPGVMGRHLGLGFVAGLLGGALLGLYGLHLARIDVTPQGRFYTPNRYLGVALTALLVGRLAYRPFIIMSMRGGTAIAAQDPAAMAAMSSMQHSALTLAIAGLLVGYYLVFYGGLLWRVHGSEPARAG